MDADEDSPRIQVLSVSDTGRRRRWSDDEKIRIVEESFGDCVTVAEVARRHDVSRSQLYEWRYRHKNGLLGSGPQFLRVMKIEDASDSTDTSPAPQAPVMTIDLGKRCRVAIPSGFDMEAAERLDGAVMIAFPAGTKVWIADGVTDMRRGMNTLALTVQQGLGRDPHAGEIFCFRGRKSDLVKLLWHDGVGMSLY